MKRRQLLKMLTGGAGFALAQSSFFSDVSFGAQQQALLNAVRLVRSQHNVPALAGAFIRGDTIEAIAATGLRVNEGTESATSEDTFHLGSCTKSMTATVMGQLVEEGLIDWDTELGDVLSILDGSILDEYKPLTPDLLLSHRSGMTGTETPDSYNPFQTELGFEFRTSEQLSKPLNEQRLAFSERVLSREPVTVPGSSHNYSNFNYVVAGALIDAVTGQMWEEVIRERLFQPLNMTSAGFGAPGSPDSQSQPWGHSTNACLPVAPGPDADNPVVYGPTGLVHANLNDWAQYAILHLQGARGESDLLLQPETFVKLQQDEFQQNYSLGWVVASQPWTSGPALIHTGSNTLWMAVIWVVPGRNAAMLAVTNCGSDNAFPAVNDVIISMIQQLL